MPTCPSDNQQTVDQTDFWTDGGIDWDAHRIGWAIAGACAAAACSFHFCFILQHCRSYTNPAEQRQILRILYMPPIYGVISFLSYRFFRSYTYYELVEAFTLSAFLMLLIEFVASSGSGHKAESSIARKDKRKLPFPFCHWRYRPTKPYFMYTLKWAVLQYVIFRPAISIAAIICQAYNVLCESEGFDAQYANVYLEAVDFVSISVALYGLFLFYGLTKEELVGRRPLAKFLAIKLIVMFTWYQSFVFDALEGRVIHATQYWTETNIADGLNALAICIEASCTQMIFFACFMWWAYTPAAYRIEGAKPTSIWRPLWDSCDFVLEIWSSFRFFISYIRGIPETRSRYAHQVIGFDEAFGLEKSGRAAYVEHNSSESVIRGQNGRTSEYDSSRAPRMSYDEDIRLAPYRYGDARDDHDASTPVDRYVSEGSHPRF
ncbi:organic solute transporter Ostalpha-domain-containing protein [Lentinula detonsa]|uniref:Organic solute transporter Ostalpha-domain-containing protein n=1 Tax=Lentinula detonsa TaxID=2804962 RepID=A0A9W8U2J1_9AGAR|nr:organic solute transporter Ostalpha-domain-containing protein [Lentinula detonsa]